jgi:isopentenyldiphosphate isomerase
MRIGTTPWRRSVHAVRSRVLLSTLLATPPLQPDNKLVAAWRSRIAAVNDVSTVGALTPLMIGGQKAGELQPDVVDELRRWPGVFTCNDTSVSLSPELEKSSLEERTEAFAPVASSLRRNGLVRAWRDELLAVTTSFDSSPALLVERACVPLLGAKGFGVALNGWSTHPETGEKFLWVGRRAPNKPTWPGMLDAIAAGAISAGSSPLEQIITEAGDEAGVPADLCMKATQPVGAVSYRGVDEWGQLKRDVFFCFDLALPWDFEPTPVDGEVGSFERLPLHAVAAAVASGDPSLFKPNINLVVVDFMLRHGHLPAESQGYLQLCAELRQGDCR